MIENVHVGLTGIVPMEKIYNLLKEELVKVPKRRRHQPGKYKPKTELPSNFTGPKPLTLFQAENGLWGAKDCNGNIELEPIYNRIEQTEEHKLRNEVHLASRDTVLSVTPEDWDIVAWFSSEFFEKDN